MTEQEKYEALWGKFQQYRVVAPGENHTVALRTNSTAGCAGCAMRQGSVLPIPAGTGTSAGSFLAGFLSSLLAASVLGRPFLGSVVSAPALAPML